jgi:2-keto-3-deoxy-L-rhamnonate aldolase RhmA
MALWCRTSVRRTRRAVIINAVRYACPADHEERLTAATIKMPKAIDDIDALLAVEGIDVVFIGPASSRRT